MNDIKLCDDNSIALESDGNPTVVKLQSTGGFGAVQLEWRSDAGSLSEWRPAFITSDHAGPNTFNGELKFFVNGRGEENKYGAVEVMRLKENGVVLSSNSETTILKLQSTAGFGAARLEWVSNAGNPKKEWRPGFIESADEGDFTGNLIFYVNGTTDSHRFGALEAMRLSRLGIHTRCIHTKAVEAEELTIDPGPGKKAAGLSTVTDEKDDTYIRCGADGISFGGTSGLSFGPRTDQLRAFAWKKQGDRNALTLNPEGDFAGGVLIQSNAKVMAPNAELSIHATEAGFAPRLEFWSGLNWTGERAPWRSGFIESSQYRGSHGEIVPQCTGCLRFFVNGSEKDSKLGAHEVMSLSQSEMHLNADLDVAGDATIRGGTLRLEDATAASRPASGHRTVPSIVRGSDAVRRVEAADGPEVSLISKHRALVHDGKSNKLIINPDGDFSGGVELHGKVLIESGRLLLQDGSETTDLLKTINDLKERIANLESRVPR